MLNIPTINTKRLILEPISMAYSQGMFDLWSNVKVTEHSGLVEDYEGNIINTPVTDPAQSDLIIDFWLKAQQAEWGFRWAILLKSKDNSFVGTIGFNSLVENYEIAYHLIPDQWGNGIMTEAAHTAIKWAEKQDVKGIEAFIEPQNKSSIALVNRLGIKETHEFNDGAQKYYLPFK